jgi:polysaccharide export outer membrane protein
MLPIQWTTLVGHPWTPRMSQSSLRLAPCRHPATGPIALARVVAVGLSISCGACSAVPGDGPFMGSATSSSTNALPFDFVDLTPNTIAAYREPAKRGRSTVSMDLAPPPSRLTAEPGDSLKVRIFERYSGSIFPTLQSQGADLGVQRVGEDGTIRVPVAGVVHVAGLDINQIEQTIIRQLGTRVQEAEVIAEFVSTPTQSVTVSGDVKTPGRVSMRDGVRTVVDAINHSGGLLTGTTSLTNQMEVMVRRAGQTILAAQFSDLLAGADIALQKGDEIVVRPNAQVITVLGAVQKSGNIEINKKNLTLLEVLGQVGGLVDQRSNKAGVYVFRMANLDEYSGPRSRVFHLDLLQPVSLFVAQQFSMQARDVLYVTNAPLYEYDKVLTVIYRTISTVNAVK